MKIGIDISQLAYQNTGVANYLEDLVAELVKSNEHEFVLFFSSFRGKLPESIRRLSKKPNVRIVKKRIPPKVLNVMWNTLHIVPVEIFVGSVDWFITSDWTEPPTKKAKKATILYDLIVYKYPKETAEKIIIVQKKKLSWVKKESSIIFCISESTKNDALQILGLAKNKLTVIYPGIKVV